MLARPRDFPTLSLPDLVPVLERRLDPRLQGERRRGPADTARETAKRAIDVVLAGTALALGWPLLLLIAGAIRLDGPGPVLFRQTRRGRLGAPFECLKFRSMRDDPSARFAQARREDPRVTRIGRVLRDTSLDELPQLVNVLRGEMSLIGPRPHPLALDNRFVDEVPGLMMRYAVRPGLSGLAQVSGHRGETPDADAMAARLALDLRYVRMRTTALDLRIVLLTLVRVWRDTAAH